MKEPGPSAPTPVAEPTTAPADPTRAAAGDLATTDDSAVPAPEPRTGLLLMVAVAWLVTILKITVALPALVGAGILAGATAGLTVTAVLAGRPLRWAAAQHGLAPATGLVTGTLAGGTVLALYGTNGPGRILAGSVGLAALLGGVLIPFVPRTVAAAALTAALGAFVVGYGLDFFLRDPLMDLFGAGRSAASGYSAGGYLAFTEATVSALVGGLLAFWYLRRASRTAAQRWTAYLLAGAAPGVLLLLAAAVTRVAGARLLALLGSISAADQTALGASAESRINYALVVLFVGGLVALLAFGRTLPKRVADDDLDDET